MSRQDAEVFGRAVGQVDKRAIKDSPKTNYQHALYESLPEQWEEWVGGLQWQTPQRAQVIDSAGRLLRISTLLLKDPPVNGQRVAAIRDRMVTAYTSHGLPPTPVPLSQTVAFTEVVE